MSINYLSTIDEIKDYLSLQGADSEVSLEYDNYLDLMRKSAKERIVQFLGYEILSKEHKDERHPFEGGYPRLYTHHRPITTITELKMDGYPTDLDQYGFESDHIYLKDNSIFPLRRIITVTYQAGWTSTTMPADIRLVALRLIALYLKESGPSGSLGLTSRETPDGSRSFDTDAEQKILRNIERYQKVV